MEEVAVLPAVVAMRLLSELEAEGIAAGTSDILGAGGGGALPGLDGQSVTVFVEDGAHLEPARAILERIQKQAGDHTEYFEGDSAADAD
ncbi:MAG: hypothetical protein VX726_00495 [Planctomycetota bacterium]|nr:hypothetical protein [Planctomycetota bacterium]MEE2894194.1 hypothetical protein [Planctomycetota bacterium]